MMKKLDLITSDQKTKRLRLLIDEGKADVLAGKVIEYKNAKDMAEKIIRRGKEKLKATD